MPCARYCTLVPGLVAGVGVGALLRVTRSITGAERTHDMPIFNLQFAIFNSQLLLPAGPGAAQESVESRAEAEDVA